MTHSVRFMPFRARAHA
ncbi:CRISPR-associated DxTHG motif protein [Micromonospora mangrovi]|uniref:CRISPR-associated DxTHG motif protein n=2 Tax=Micromonospora TaxID=1873 RepID=A0AAU8HLB6_9ACTN